MPNPMHPAHSQGALLEEKASVAPTRCCLDFDGKRSLAVAGCSLWWPTGRFAPSPTSAACDRQALDFFAPAFVPALATFFLSMTAKLEVDRFGVPQYNGEPELYEEYAERAWDLWYGREGSEATQSSTPIHLRSGLTGPAYDAVRKLSHADLIAKDSDGKPSTKGIQLLLKTLRESIDHEKPVKTNELFFTVFYSPTVWRFQSETMQAYIVRREQEFRRLEEVLGGATLPESLRAMCLLTFGGLDHREQLNVLSSVGNDYDLKKVSHALRIQFPTCSGKPVHRKDYLGCGRGQVNPLLTSARMRPKPFSSKGGKGKHRGYALVAEDGQDDIEDDEVFYDDDLEDHDDEAYEVEGEDAGDDAVEALAQDLDLAEDPELVDAFATILQRKKGMKQQGKGSGSKGQSQSFPFQAKGEVTVDQRTRAIKFLKSVTPCTSCGLKGHWAGDAECQNSKKGGKGTSQEEASSLLLLCRGRRGGR